ncbi:hypothetical protein [Corynebacterium stationis]|uniref:hypothetical protein n=1 Tax=Corynebacterium stationis TaxID=1705 RepID=UPI0012EB0D33|nr:hypothetical protein [Corynebacterium stationis]
MTILHQATDTHNKTSINMQAFKAWQAGMKRRYHAAQRCEPLAHRPGDDRGFSMHWSN